MHDDEWQRQHDTPRDDRQQHSSGEVRVAPARSRPPFADAYEPGDRVRMLDNAMHTSSDVDGVQGAALLADGSRPAVTPHAAPRHRRPLIGSRWWPVIAVGLIGALVITLLR